MGERQRSTFTLFGTGVWSQPPTGSADAEDQDGGEAGTSALLTIEIPSQFGSPAEVATHAAASARRAKTTTGAPNPGSATAQRPASPPPAAPAPDLPVLALPDPGSAALQVQPPGVSTGVSILAEPEDPEDERDRSVIETLIDATLTRSPLSEPVCAVTLLAARVANIMSDLVKDQVNEQVYDLVSADGPGEAAGLRAATLATDPGAPVLPGVSEAAGPATLRLAEEPVRIAVEPLASNRTTADFGEIVEALAGPALCAPADQATALVLPAAPARDQRRRALATSSLRTLGGVGIATALRSLAAAWLARAGVEWVEDYLETLALQSASVRVVLARDQTDDQATDRARERAGDRAGLAAVPSPTRPPLSARERAGLRVDGHDQEVARILLGFVVLQQRARQIGMRDQVATTLGTQRTLHEALILLAELAPSDPDRNTLGVPPGC